MSDVRPDHPACPLHGKPRHRRTCRSCNAAYMRGYLSAARKTRPTSALLTRARQRAVRQGVPYTLRRQDISMPHNCPVLGLPLTVGASRCASSPSLDRINPAEGYQPGNVRIISDQANRLKSNRSLEEVVRLSQRGVPERQAQYAAVAAYMEREALLAEVKRKAAIDPSPGRPWQVIADFLEKRFREYMP